MLNVEFHRFYIQVLDSITAGILAPEMLVGEFEALGEGDDNLQTVAGNIRTRRIARNITLILRFNINLAEAGSILWWMGRGTRSKVCGNNRVAFARQLRLNTIVESFKSFELALWGLSKGGGLVAQMVGTAPSRLNPMAFYLRRVPLSIHFFDNRMLKLYLGRVAHSHNCVLNCGCLKQAAPCKSPPTSAAAPTGTRLPSRPTTWSGSCRFPRNPQATARR